MMPVVLKGEHPATLLKKEKRMKKLINILFAAVMVIASAATMADGNALVYGTIQTMSSNSGPGGYMYNNGSFNGYSYTSDVSGYSSVNASGNTFGIGIGNGVLNSSGYIYGDGYTSRGSNGVYNYTSSGASANTSVNGNGFASQFSTSNINGQSYQWNIF